MLIDNFNEISEKDEPGEFHFPNRLAAEIAVDTVWRYKGDTEVIFNVFKDIDYQIYRELLG